MYEALIIAFIVLTFAQCVYIWWQQAEIEKLRATLAKRDATITEQANAIAAQDRMMTAMAVGMDGYRIEREYEHGRG